MATEKLVDHYELLQVSRQANRATIEHVFRLLAKQAHPSAPEGGDEARFRQIVAAFETLQDPKKRAAYDQTLVAPADANGEHAELLEGASAAGEDCIARYKLLSLLYAKRRQDSNKPGIGMATLEEMVPYPREEVTFHLWYFREKGWTCREESGQYSITAFGIDYIEAMNQEAVSARLAQEPDSAETEPNETKPTETKPAPVGTNNVAASKPQAANVLQPA